MLGRSEMLGSVLILGTVATSDVPTAQTKTQVDPRVAGLQAFFAALGLGFDRMDLIGMRADISHGGLLEA
jgi:hypothetical protein